MFTSWPDRLVKRIEKSRAKKRARVSVESGAVELSKQRESAQRSRHIERRYLKIRDWVAEGHIVVKYKNTTDNRADVFTKPLAAEDFDRHMNSLMGMPARDLRA